MKRKSWLMALCVCLIAAATLSASAYGIFAEPEETPDAQITPGQATHAVTPTPASGESTPTAAPTESAEPTPGEEPTPAGETTPTAKPEETLVPTATPKPTQRPHYGGNGNANATAAPTGEPTSINFGGSVGIHKTTPAAAGEGEKSTGFFGSSVFKAFLISAIVLATALAGVIGAIFYRRAHRIRNIQVHRHMDGNSFSADAEDFENGTKVEGLDELFRQTSFDDLDDPKE